VDNPNFDLNIIFIDPQRNRGAVSSDVLLNEFPWNDLKKKPLLVVLLDWGRTQPARTSPAVNYTAI